MSAVCRATNRDIQKCVSDVFAPHFYQEKTILKVIIIVGQCCYIIESVGSLLLYTRPAITRM